ncbi:OmpA/MotB family protein [Pseudobacteriovorax antillogorgiicola]|uniref:Chemotaxis protein MotB n=1 Tax=Pseudobacteriovorax antillogorgiicola TaxID=1513793 RepID=A0A1Y6BYP1_9BACT|nr:flagellar motor protein MotB [Pseudobacteriovorax antillogorgiicola]TCS50197.1 chemotaxis protein MotB [Pseudobacteriovorax antillogorgiicola]SMF32228.1 chemotaxis protein MotB [Pseudobacteriovorax antillogorgiicola]
MAKKQKCPEFENHERWLVSFADMMTLLFAVFVVLYALKEEGAKDSQVEQAAASIQEAFNEVMEEIPENRRVGPTDTGFGIFENMKGDREEPHEDNKFPGSSDYSQIIGREMKKVSELIDLRLYGNQRFRELQAKGQARIISIHRDRDGFRVRLLASHFFNPGSYKIKNKKVLDELEEVARVMQELNRPITIEGHTDNVPFNGEGSNWDLSALRASNVLKFFIRKTTFDPTKLSAAGYADTRPVASNATAESRGLNRRIEIKVHYE